MVFQSTLPVWGATDLDEAIAKCQGISIHAPRVGSDGNPFAIASHTPYFNPRSPCGERQVATASSWEKFVISIHAPRVGSDIA